MRLRRSMLFVPGSNAAAMSTAFVFKPDAIMFDLEDAVSLREKDAARLLVYHALGQPLYDGIERVVRINPLNTPFGHHDLQAAIRGGADTIRLPKTDDAGQVQELEAEVEKIERSCGREIGSTHLMAAIESASGVVNALAIAHSSPRITGIALAGFDYVMDMQTERGDGTELFYARCAVLHAARAAGIDAFDVVFSDLDDEEGFLKEVALIRKLGFNGKSLINPRQIELLHNAYAPTQEEVDYARRVVAAAKKAEGAGAGRDLARRQDDRRPGRGQRPARARPRCSLRASEGVRQWHLIAPCPRVSPRSRGSTPASRTPPAPAPMATARSCLTFRKPSVARASRTA